MTSPMIIAGIDPGLSGAVAFLDAASGAVLDIADMPTLALSRAGKNKRELDAHALAHLIGDRRPGHVFIELVGAMPGQGVSSVFAFGKSFGVVIGVLAAQQIAFTFVSPVTWKRGLGVPAAKGGARARASQLMPSATRHRQTVSHGPQWSALIFEPLSPRERRLFDAA
jgi:crossover junction endodeoxyribonuclease RuvC